MKSALCGFRRALGLTATFALLAVSSASAQLLNGAVWFEREVGAGVKWRYYQFDNLFGAKQSVSYMEVDLANPAVDLTIRYRNSYVGPSPGTTDPAYPRAPTSTFANEVPNARAAINGSYFNTQSYDSANPSTPWGGGTGYLKVGGSVVHTFDGTNINNHGMGIAFNTKNDLTLLRRPALGGSCNSNSSLWGCAVAPSWQNLLVCGPVLLENGVVETYDVSNTHATARHPRTAFGKNTAANKVILLTVDGRTAEAAGMSCSELAQVIKALGCDYAINLDGGGSTTLWAAGEPFSGVVNYPSDNGAYDHLGQRSCANALVISSADPVTTAWDGRLTALSYSTLSRSSEPLTVTATYTNLGTQTWTAANVKVVPSRSFGRTSSFVPSGQENTFFSMSPASVAPGQTATITLNLTPPVVANNTVYRENFALWHPTVGYFGPADNKLQVNTTVRPQLAGAPPLMIVQGTPTGPNNQWYDDSSGGWGPSTISFTAEGVNNSGSQRYCGAGTTNRYALFEPIFEVNGNYRVDVAYPYSSNSITAVQYIVNHSGGSQTFTQNQNTAANGNTWHTLGTFPFSTGTSAGGTKGLHNVRVTNGTTTGNRFYSGAVRFDYVSPLAGISDWSIY